MDVDTFQMMAKKNILFHLNWSKSFKDSVLEIIFKIYSKEKEKCGMMKSVEMVCVLVQIIKTSD